jgi:hypothetical protein
MFPAGSDSNKNTDMAHVTPPISAIRALSAGEHTELDLLRRLADGLPDRYELFHSVDWTRSDPRGDSHGELDIVVVNDAGDLALLEVKGGVLTLEAEGLFKQYGAENKDVGRQAEWQFSGIQHRLRNEGLAARLMHFLVLPHQRVGEHSAVAYPRDRIADATDCEDLLGFIQRKLGSGQPGELKARVCAFLQNRLTVQPDVSALAGSLKKRVTQISDGLATWVPRIHAPSGVVRVRGTAGSGKTQLALTLLRQARVKNQVAAYVCFNRPLADQMREFAPDGVEVTSFHQLCWDAAGRPVTVADYNALATRYVTVQAQAAADLDLLVIDELQDMQAEWLQALLSRVRDDGRIYLLDDPAQCLYPDREEIDIAEAVVITSNENYRSPRKVVETINFLCLTDEPVQACSPFEGELPNIRSYDPAGGGLARVTVKAVQGCLDKGFALQDIVVLSWRGRESSRLMSLECLGDWKLARFTGDYDQYGRPIWTEGDLKVETIRRFKGQSAPAIVLTEVDFDELTPLRRNLLFVGLTRAQMHLEWVASEAAQQALARHCG